MEDKIKKLL